MFGLITGLTKAVVGAVVETPVALVADVVTLGGATTDKSQPYTADALANALAQLQKAVR
jgi:hypothetical protein